MASSVLRMRRFFFGVILLMLSCQPPTVSSRWMVYYGKTLGTSDLKNVDLVVLDPDQMRPPAGVRAVGYLSLGEAEDYRSYWPKVEGASFLVESNPQWPGAHRIDMRSGEWRDLILNELIPGILAKGFSGVFLDTIDTASYLEEINPGKFGGSAQAAVRLVSEMRLKFPKMSIIVNNGFALLPGIENYIDGVAVEDLYTRYDFNTKTVGPTPPAETVEKEKILDGFIRRTHKPVLNILYETPDSETLSRESISRSEKKGYLWYLTSVDLMHVGRVPKKSLFHF